jgi:hypothetical protein
MEQHVKILAILNLVYGGLGVLAIIVILVVFGGTAGLVAADHDPEAGVAVGVMGAVGGFAALCVALFSAPPFVAGIGLLKMRPWARTWTLVASIINLLSIPFGTALGIYGLWVILKDETVALLRRQYT